MPDRQRAAPAMHIRKLYELWKSTTASLPSTRRSNSRVAMSINYDHQFRKEALLAMSWRCKYLTRNQENVLQDSSCPVQMPKACLRNSTFESQMTFAWTQELTAIYKWKLRRIREGECMENIGELTEVIQWQDSLWGEASVNRGGAECIVLDEVYVDTLGKLWTRCDRGMYWTIWIKWTVHIKRTA